ncbi:molybdenum cofactor guanylyltransferase [Aeoliella sp.]|uniref:molybdenum cofactor guanylyltransferase n=1 Tax=Aeoliella sp. TaxID=2795800 RepID=UPI003CCB94ED
MNLWAVILCGGGSRRMGSDKATLDFRGEPMLSYVVRRLSAAISLEQMVCVAAQGQTLPKLPAEVSVVRDRNRDCGPLEGLATGLTAAQDAHGVFVTTCDAPLVSPEFVTLLASMLKDHEAVVPQIDEQLYPLTAVYRPSAAKLADERLRRGERRVIDWVAELNTRYMSRGELAKVDPELWSLRSCNTPEEYTALVELDSR